MLTTIGILLIIIGIGTLLLKSIFTKTTSLDWFTTKRSLQLTFLGVFMSIVTGMFFYAEPGTAYAVQYPWGTQKAVFKQGINTKMWGRLIPIQFEMPIKYVIPNEDGKFGDQSKYAYIDAARHWEFNDAVKGKIATSIVVSINTTDENQFLSVADRNKTEKNLIRSRIIPNIELQILLKT